MIETAKGISHNKRRVELWTPNQKKTLLGLCVVLLIFLGVESVRKPIQLSDPLPIASSRTDEILDRLNPNTADAAALSAIPNLGENRAKDIVAYRDVFTIQHPGIPPFKSTSDLMHVKGIGPGISSNMEPYLQFSPQN